MRTRTLQGRARARTYSEAGRGGNVVKTTLGWISTDTVSYTHLTLPTKRIV